MEKHLNRQVKKVITWYTLLKDLPLFSEEEPIEPVAEIPSAAEEPAKSVEAAPVAEETPAKPKAKKAAAKKA